jgi:hypothetical protein
VETGKEPKPPIPASRRHSAVPDDRRAVALAAALRTRSRQLRTFRTCDRREKLSALRSVPGSSHNRRCPTKIDQQTDRGWEIPLFGRIDRTPKIVPDLLDQILRCRASQAANDRATKIDPDLLDQMSPCLDDRAALRGRIDRATKTRRQSRCGRVDRAVVSLQLLYRMSRLRRANLAAIGQAEIGREPIDRISRCRVNQVAIDQVAAIVPISISPAVIVRISGHRMLAIINREVIAPEEIVLVATDRIFGHRMSAIINREAIVLEVIAQEAIDPAEIDQMSDRQMTAIIGREGIVQEAIVPEEIDRMSGRQTGQMTAIAQEEIDPEVIAQEVEIAPEAGRRIDQTMATALEEIAPAEIDREAGRQIGPISVEIVPVGIGQTSDRHRSPSGRPSMFRDRRSGRPWDGEGRCGRRFTADGTTVIGAVFTMASTAGGSAEAGTGATDRGSGLRETLAQVGCCRRRCHSSSTTRLF